MGQGVAGVGEYVRAPTRKKPRFGETGFMSYRAETGKLIAQLMGLPSAILPLIDAVSVLLFTAGVLWTAYTIACRAFRVPSVGATHRRHRRPLRQLTAAFLLLSALHLFIAPVAIVLWTGAALAAHRYARSAADPVRLAAADLRAIGGWWRALPSSPA